MNFPSINPTETNAWKALKDHFESIKAEKMKDWFAKDPQRAEEFSIAWKDVYVDYSKNRITAETKQLLLNLADEVKLKDAIEAQFSGEKINQTEDREVLHTALRDAKTKVSVNGESISKDVQDNLDHMQFFSESIINGDWKGHTGKPITDVVNIGIGGSDLGPQMVVDALQFYKNHLNVHFVSNVDGDHISETLKHLNPETTLIVIVSKTFTTQETLTNANTARRWFLKNAEESAIAKHFVAVSTNATAIKEFGISEKNSFTMWNWVGGRFSLWSSVGLSISLAVGFNNFKQLLDGAKDMDSHFRNTEFSENIPVITALLTVWYNNFYGAESEAIIPYSQYLQKLAPYLQQGIMESNGKGIDRNGKQIDYETGTIIWGEPGTNSQHAFFQLIHQGTKLIPSDFIGFKTSLHGNTEHHDKLMANYFAQTEALLQGKDETTVVSELKNKGLSESEIKALTPFKIFEGNRPTTSILIDKLTPKSLGSLIAMYEHKLFVQGVIWNIFSYDQWGVELGKQLANTILEDLKADGLKHTHDASTSKLLKRYKS
ncbi:glucose-6-phosphate isomerase [Croceibacter atlanticus]|uniref:glucose-6-phosphate isomerase n=1 Tax=Croceibacter atlanticus TaxID=313588 RepID=UPI002E13EA00|nr:glucose-6-phosphate isomerase [Croceibacter atlanticus]